jgi:hypothetical protein
LERLPFGLLATTFDQSGRVTAIRIAARGRGTRTDGGIIVILVMIVAMLGVPSLHVVRAQRATGKSRLTTGVACAETTRRTRLGSRSVR